MKALVRTSGVAVANSSLSVASEHRSWLLYYSLPVLKDVLPDAYFENYSLLVAAIYILSSDRIEENDLVMAEQWLKKFYRDYAGLYGIIIAPTVSEMYLRMQLLDQYSGTSE